MPDVDAFDPVFIGGDANLSYTLTGVGLYVAYLEPFIVKSVRRVLADITDPKLAEDADSFCRQEAQHYQQHQRFNELIFAQGYPGLESRCQALAADFERYLVDESDQFRVGFVEGFESMTTQGALALMKSGVLDKPQGAADGVEATPAGEAFRHLFRWHLVEEIEHRNVAFDLYENLYGDYWYRVRMCMVAQSHITRFLADCRDIMAPFDTARYGSRCRVPTLMKWAVSSLQWIPRLKSCLPNYTPHRYVVPENIGRVAAYYTEQAAMTRR